MKAMRRTISIFLMILFLLGMCPDISSAEDEWTGADKAAHLIGAFAISTTMYNVYKKNTSMTQNQCKAAAFFTTVAIASIKEFADDEFSGKDMAADAAGAAIGVIVGLEF